MRIALGQINTTVGDMAGNVARMVDAAKEAAGRNAEIVVFPELAVTGYPPRDLMEKPSFLERAEQELARLAELTAPLGIVVVAGCIARSQSDTGKHAVNLAAVLQNGHVLFRQTKMLLPTYDVFDEGRYFVPATRQEACELNGRRLGIIVCEDAWNDKQYWQRPLYERDPVQELLAGGGQALISINASPFHMGKRALRREIFQATARRYGVPVIYVNQVGGNDQLVFDGSSFAINKNGEVIASARSFAEDLVLVDIDTGQGDWNENLPEETEAVYEALVLGTRASAGSTACSWDCRAGSTHR